MVPSFCDFFFFCTYDNKFKFGRNAAKERRNFHPAFGEGTANERSIQTGFGNYASEIRLFIKTSIEEIS